MLPKLRNKSNANFVVATTTAGIVVAGGIYLLNRNKVVLRAKKYLGIRETSNDVNFSSSEFKQKLKSVGWQEGWAWCAIFVKLVFSEVFTGAKRTILMSLMNASSQSTWQNLKNNASKYIWIKVLTKAKRGAIVVWQYQEDKSRGHLGIVTNVMGNKFMSIEGNQGANGKVNIVSHNISEFNKTSGNKLIGFILIT